MLGGNHPYVSVFDSQAEIYEQFKNVFVPFLHGISNINFKNCCNKTFSSYQICYPSCTE